MLVYLFTYVIASAFMFAIVFGYCTAGLLSGEWWPIPTISKTWDMKPANFVSRFIIGGYGSMSLAVLHVAIYFATKDTFANADLCLLVSLIATFSLSVVSAVCMEDSSPECLGSVKVHDGFATTYFILIDIYCAILSSQETSAMLYARMTKLFSGLLLPLGFLISVSIPKEHLPSWFTLGFFEWLNTFSVLIYLTSFAKTRLRTMRIGFIDVSPRKPVSTTTIVHWSLASSSLVPLSLGTCLATIGLCYAITINQDPGMGRNVPEISDMFVFPPANDIARFGGGMGSTLLSLVFFQFYFVYKKFVKAPVMCLATSQIMVVFLSLSMCISKVEDTLVHSFCVAAFYCLAQLVMVWIASNFNAAQDPNDDDATWINAPIFLALACKVRFFYLQPADYHVFAFFELVDTAAIIFFIGSFAWFKYDELENIPLALYDYV